jgi:4-diphosphocytidyl-2-C-methyl-D-erythritol kinase
VTGLPALPAVIVCPASGLSTAAVYAACRPAAERRGDASRLVAALATGGLRGAIPFVTNALEPAARRLSAEVDELLGALAAAGAVCPRLTGSGSACFTLARSLAEARAVAARLAAVRTPDGARRWPGVFAVRLAAAGRRCGAAA